MAAITRFSDLLARAADGPPVAVALVAAESPTALHALAEATATGIAEPVLVGPESAVRALIERESVMGMDGARFIDAPTPQAAARRAIELARGEEVQLLLKGALRTDQLMRAALDRAAGLRTGRLLSDVLLYEDTLAGTPRLVGVTDGGINPGPDLEALKAIVTNAVEVFRVLGYERPRVALLSASEAVTDRVASTVAARAVADWAAEGLPDADVSGPLALDNALLDSAARAKGITGPVAGRADIMVAPSIEAGNILGKAAKYLGRSITAHVVVGAAVPLLIPSRVESAADKLHSIALGALMGRAAPGVAASGVAARGRVDRRGRR